YFQKEDFEVVQRVVEVAQEKDVSPAQIALAWLYSNDTITAPIVGITKVQHLEEAVDALDIRLNDKEIMRLEECYSPHPVIGHT
ncbi:MAG: aldo/keto reductase, partial [Candidatus Hodarchaeales archaeon]